MPFCSQLGAHAAATYTARAAPLLAQGCPRGPRGASTLAAWMPTAGGGAPVPAQGRWLSPRLTAQVDLACRRATSGPRRRRRRQAGRLDPARWRDGAARRRDEAQRRDGGLHPLHPLCALFTLRKRLGPCSRSIPTPLHPAQPPLPRNHALPLPCPTHAVPLHPTSCSCPPPAKLA